MLDDHRPSHSMLQVLVLDRIDASQNMARYYVLSIEPTLFGETAMVREWGRIGSFGQRRTELYAQREDARMALGTWLDRKLRRGYQLRIAPALHGGNGTTRLPDSRHE